MKTEIPVIREIESFIPYFLESRNKEILTINNLIIQKNFSEVEKICHNLKGVARSYGFPTLGNFAEEMENSCKVKDYDNCINLIDKIKSYLSKYNS